MMKKLVCLFLLCFNLNSFCQNVELRSEDTLRFVGIPRDPNDVPAVLNFWRENAFIHYSETWKVDSLISRITGKVLISEGLPIFYSYQFRQNNILKDSETVEHTGDSIIIVRRGMQTALKSKPGEIYLPKNISAPLSAILIQCIMRLKENTFKSVQYGNIRMRQVAETVLSGNDKTKKKLFLHILYADSIPDAEHVWLDKEGNLFSILNADGTWDFLPNGFGKKDQEKILQAEFLAAQSNEKAPSRGRGFGPMSCETGKFLCQVTTQGGECRTFTISDSGYSIKSDGLGPYVHGVDGIRIFIGIMGGMLINSTSRSYTIDLNHPVKDDKSVPMGVIKVSGWPGKFIPAGNDFFAEFSAQWYTEADYKAHSLLDIPIGTTVYTEQLSPDFYIDGKAYVLQIGPQPVGHCLSSGTTIHGTGTTKGTIKRESETKWTIDLPPGSIGRLFDVHQGDEHAIDKGLYYVSLHFVIER